MKFTTIKFDGNIVGLKWEDEIGGAVDKHEWTCDEPPTPAFKAALDAFSTFVVDIVAAPEAWVEGLDIRQLSLKTEETGARGLVVTALRKCEKAKNRALLLNSPYLAEAPEGHNGPMTGYLTSTVLELIETAESEAEKYKNGERGEQVELALEDSENTKNVNDRMAAAEVGSTRKARGKNPNRGKPEMHHVQNPDATEPPLENEELRKLLGMVDREVPIDAIARWTRSDFVAATAWARARQKAIVGTGKPTLVPDEPECVKKAATLPLTAEEFHRETPEE